MGLEQLSIPFRTKSGEGFPSAGNRLAQFCMTAVSRQIASIHGRTARWMELIRCGTYRGKHVIPARPTSPSAAKSGHLVLILRRRFAWEGSGFTRSKQPDGAEPPPHQVRNVMPGFKQFKGNATTVFGIDLLHRIREGQFHHMETGPEPCHCVVCMECAIRTRGVQQPTTIGKTNSRHTRFFTRETT